MADHILFLTGKLAKKIEDLAERGVIVAAEAAPSGDDASQPSSAALSAGADWAGLVQRVEDTGQLRLAQLMRDWVRVVELSPGRLVYQIAEGLSDDPRAELRDCLFRVTGNRWAVEQGQGEAAPTLREQEQAARGSREAAIREHPLVKATLEAFSHAELLSEPGIAAQSGGKWSR